MTQLHRENPIAVFDSGVGGISVLAELVRLMPEENFIYFGDSKNAPYGTKTLEEVRELTNAHAKRLFEEGAKGLVVACNTATSASVRVLRELYPDIPIVGIEPAVKPASACKEHPNVLVLATPMTIREEKLKRLMQQYEDAANIYPLPCPGLMDFVERGEVSGERLEAYLTELFYPYKEIAVDAVVLGCTHYPFVKDSIQKVLGKTVQLFDGGEGTAREMRRRLTEANLRTQRTQKGEVVFTNSLDNSDKIEMCKTLLSQKLGDIS